MLLLPVVAMEAADIAKLNEWQGQVDSHATYPERVAAAN